MRWGFSPLRLYGLPLAGITRHAGLKPPDLRLIPIWDKQLASVLFHPENRSCYPAHASIYLAAQGTQHERGAGGRQLGEKPFALITSDLADVFGSLVAWSNGYNQPLGNRLWVA